MGPEKESKKSTQTVVRQQLQQQKQQQDQLQQMHNQGAQLANEVRTQSTEQKPGFFRRVWNWIKGAFSKLFSGGKNTQTQSGGDAMDTFVESQATAPAPDPVLQTLSPAQTAPDTFKAAEENENTAQDTLQVDQGTQEVSQESQTPAQDMESSRDTQEEPVQVAQAPQIEDGGSLTIGTVTFALCSKQEDGTYMSKGGTAQVLGEQVRWTSEQGVRLDQSNLSSPIQGVIHVAEGALKLKNLEVSGGWENLHFAQQEGSEFLYHAGETDLSFVPEGDLGDLSQVTGSKIQVVNRSIPVLGELPEFTSGSIELSKSGLKLEGTSVQMDSIREKMPEYFYAKTVELSLYGDGTAAMLGVDFHDFALRTKDSDAVSVVSFETSLVRAPIGADGRVALAMPKNTIYKLQLCGTMVGPDMSGLFGDTVFYLGEEATVTAVEFQPQNVSAGGFDLENVCVGFDVESGFSVNIGKLTGMDGKLVGSGVAVVVTEHGLKIPRLSFAYHDSQEQAMENAVFEVQDFLIGADGVTFQKAEARVTNAALIHGTVTAVAATATIKKHPNLMEMDVIAAGTLKYKNDYLNFSGKNFDLSIHYAKATPPQIQTGGNSAQGSEHSQADGAQGGEFAVTVNSPIQATALVDDIPVADISFQNGISVTNGIFSLGNMEAYLNLDPFDGAFSTKGSIKAQQITVGATGIHAESFQLFFLEPTVAGITVVESVELKKDPTQGYTATISSEKPLEFHIKGCTITSSKYTVVMNLQQKKLRPWLENTQFTVKAGENTISGEITSANLGQPIQLGSIAVENQTLTEAMQGILPVEGFQVLAENVTIGAAFDSVSVGTIGVSAQTDISLFGQGLKLTEVKATVSAPDFPNIKGIELSGSLTYEGGGLVQELSGTGTFSMRAENQYCPDIEAIKDVSLKLLDYGSASIGSIQASQTEKELIFQEISISKSSRTQDVSTEIEGDESNSNLLKAMIAAAPSVDWVVDEIRYGPQGFQMDPENVKVKSIQQEVELADGWKLDLEYESESQSIGAKLQGGYDLPEERKGDPKKKKEVVSASFLNYAILPLVTLQGRGFVDAGMSFSGELGGKFASGSFVGNFGAQCTAGVDAGLGVKLVLGVPGVNASVELDGVVGVEADSNIQGIVQVLHDATKSDLKSGLSIGREQTKLGYGFSAALNFDVRCAAGVKVPSIFDASTSTLSKSWNLFHYNFGNAQIQGNIYYVGDKVQFDSNSQLEFNRPGAFKFDIAQEKLGELTTSSDKIQADNQLVCDLLEKHADALGLGQVRDALRIKQSIVLMELLTGNLQEAANKYKEVQTELSRIKKNLPRILELAQRSKMIQEDTIEAAKVIGIGVDENNQVTMTREAFIRELETDPAKKDELAKLDPLAVFNTFKVYKGKNAKSWGEEYKTAQTLSNKMREKDVPAQGTNPKIKPGDKKIGKLHREYLQNINGLILKSMGDMTEFGKTILGVRENLDRLEKEKQELSDADFYLAADLDALSRRIRVENDKKAEYEEKKKKHQDNQIKLVTLSKEYSTQQKILQEAVNKRRALGGSEKLHDAYNVADNTFKAAQSLKTSENEQFQQQYLRIAQGHSQESREDLLKEKKDLVQKLLEHLKGETDTAQASGDTRVAERAAGVAKGNIIEKRLQARFLNPLQGKQMEEWKELYDSYYRQSEKFDEQYQDALGLYRQLTGTVFRNVDDEDRTTVSKQNILLSTTCKALNSNLSQKSTQALTKDAEDLNAKIANLSKK